MGCQEDVVWLMKVFHITKVLSSALFRVVLNMLAQSCGCIAKDGSFVEDSFCSKLCALGSD